MKKITFFILTTLFVHLHVFSNELPKMQSMFSNTAPLHEMRSVWLTTVKNLDWPHTYACSANSIAIQKKELCDILDKLSLAGINTVLLQTRVRATTIFPSKLEPWDACMSGIPSQSPGYDALAFAIDECHKRGIKLHAWVVTIPIGKWNSNGCTTLRNSYPKLVKRIEDEGYMNPEVKETSEYIARFCLDITKRYDIDGIHLDYIRYPDSWKAIKDRDKARRNITRIINAVHDSIKKVKPWVMLSCATVGKYADTKRQSSRQWNARDVVCQDAALWLNKGLVDALFPMMYFRDENFFPFAIDWHERSAERIITPGLGIYFLAPNEKDWELGVITQEMHVLRNHAMGSSLFRSRFLTDNTKGISDFMQNNFALFPSLQPVMDWYMCKRPAAPIDLKKTNLPNGDIILSWNNVDTVRNNSDSVACKKLYNIYGSNCSPVNTQIAENLLMAAYDGTTIVVPRSHSIKFFAVTAVDRFGNESMSCQMHIEKKHHQYTIHNVPGRPLVDNVHLVYLDSCDVSDGQLIELQSTIGTTVKHVFAKKNGTQQCFDVKGLPIGHYNVYLINKRGYRHRLGTFSREKY